MSKNESGKTALDLALKSGKHDVARLIVSYSVAIVDEMAQIDPKRRSEFMGGSCHNCVKPHPNMLKCVCTLAQYYSKEC